MQDIRIKNVSKTYGEKQVLSQLSKEFPAGETTVIMGASGCGKTTLLRILLGLEKADSGEVTGMPERVAVLFQPMRILSLCWNVRRRMHKGTRRSAG